MSQLHAVLIQQSLTEREALAKRCGTTWHFLRRVMYGQLPPNSRLAVALERETGVNRRDLRPTDWGDIWPELVDTEHPWPPVAANPGTQEAA